MNIDPNPEWVIRQGFACVWVRAPTAREAVEKTARRLGHMGGWKVGPDIDQQVFSTEDYRGHTQPGDYVRSLITASEGSQSS